MKIGKMLHLFLIIVLAGCSANNFNLPSQTSTVETPIKQTLAVTKTPYLSTLISPTPSKIPLISITSATSPSYKVIDENNVGQLILVHQWEVENVYQANIAFWFSDSNQFIMPIRKASVDGIQSFDVNNFSETWFAPADSYETSIVANDQVITYLQGLHIFNKQGIEIQTLKAEGKCNESTSSQMIAIQGTDLIVTGHWHYGDIINSYGKSRLLVWSRARNTCTELVKEFVGKLWSLSASDDGRYISYSVLTSTQDLVAEHTTYVYDINLQKVTCHLVGLFIEFNHQNQLAVSDSPKPGMISLIMPSNCTTQLVINGDIDLIALAFNPTSDLLATASESIISFWSGKTGEMVNKIESQSGGWPIIGFSPDGRFFVGTKSKISPTENDKILLWGIPGN